MNFNFILMIIIIVSFLYYYDIIYCKLNLIIKFFFLNLKNNFFLILDMLIIFNDFN